MAVTRDVVYSQRDRLIKAKDNIPDPSVLKEQIQCLKEKVDELYSEWQTESSEISKAEFKSLISDIDMIVPPYHNIKSLQSQEPNIVEEEKKHLLYYN